jgi:hypothetical protein
MVVHTCNPSYLGNGGRRISICGWLEQKHEILLNSYSITLHPAPSYQPVEHVTCTGPISSFPVIWEVTLNNSGGDVWHVKFGTISGPIFIYGPEKWKNHGEAVRKEFWLFSSSWFWVPVSLFSLVLSSLGWDSVTWNQNMLIYIIPGLLPRFQAEYPYNSKKTSKKAALWVL